MSNQKINIDRIKQDLLKVGSINSGNKGYNRLAFSIEEKKAMEWLKKELIKMDLSVSEDSVGNVFGRLGSTEQPAIAFGSHLDTVKNGGLYDGALGVIIGLECLRTLRENGYDGNPLEIICFIGEEANPLGGTFGSRAVGGLIKDEGIPDSDLEKFGYTFEKIKEAQKSTKDFISFLELHIEQGSVLETNKKQVGIVTSIAGISRMYVRVKGKASHSGTTPMKLRNDALLSASTIVLQVNNLATNLNSDIVATVGKMEVHPNSENVVPGDVQLTIEIRGSDWEKLKKFERELKDWMIDSFVVEIEEGVQKRPSSLSKNVQQVIDYACNNLSVDFQYIVSGANHDANSLTGITDVGMIFIPSKDGLSHHPDEFTSWEEIEVGANVMLHSILELSKRTSDLKLKA